MVQISSWSRLGEPISPKRERVSPKPHFGHLSKLLDSECVMDSYNSRLGEKESLGRNLQSFATAHTPKTPKQCQFTLNPFSFVLSHQPIHKTPCKHVGMSKIQDLTSHQNYNTKTPIRFLFHTNKTFHPTTHSQFLNFNAYQTNSHHTEIQFKNKTQKPKQYWCTRNLSTPNLELVIKNWDEEILDSHSPSWSSPCTLTTLLTLSNLCFSL